MHIIKNEKELELLISNNITIIYFYADWCGQCKSFESYYENLENEYKNINFCKINVDNNKSLTKKIGIMSIPTIVIYKDNKEIERFIKYIGNWSYLL